jgi:hypothetical protein
MLKMAFASLAVLATASVAQAQFVDFRDGSNSPRIYSPNGEYLGNLNRNQFDPNKLWKMGYRKCPD